jgi:type II secretory pathway component PulC
MPEDRPVTPEKQLLRLIEDHKEENGNKKIEAHAIKHFSLSLFSFGAWIGRLSFLKEKFKGWFGQDKFYPFDIKVINNFLIFCFIALIVYFTINFSYSIINLKKIPNLEVKAGEEGQLAGAQQGAGLKRAVSYYVEKVVNRDIFKMGPKNPALAKKGPSEIAIEATKNFKLVGISWSDNPDAMIEDSKAMRTYFVKRGQMIGDVKVEAIFKEKVILNYSGEDIELK